MLYLYKLYCSKYDDIDSMDFIFLVKLSTDKNSSVVIEPWII